jgi:hypothetical protein
MPDYRPGTAARQHEGPGSDEKPDRQGRRAGGRFRSIARLPRWVPILTGSVVVVALVVSGYLLLKPPSVSAHVISAPAKLGGYVNDPAIASTSDAKGLRTQIVKGAAGEVKNVISAVYEKSTGAGTGTGPQIIVFIGGNLIGSSSAASVISGFMTQTHGSFTTSAGILGGQAACAPSRRGRLAECAWADDDTFGVIISPTLTVAGLATELRELRPLVEHVAK